MRALVCERAGEVALRDVPEPSPGPGDVVVHVEAALTCGTDLKMIRRGHPKVPFPAILGHEFAGIVAEAGEGARFAVGERVTCAVTGPCGRCPDCLAGRENLCPTAFDRPVWGAFAEYIRVPERVAARGLKVIPESLAYASAALLDPLASVVRGLARTPAGSSSTVLVYGSGPIALMFVALARQLGVARLWAAGRRTARLATLEQQGAEPIDLTSRSVRGVVKDATRGRGADVVIDTTGDAGVASDLFELVSRGGTVLLFAGFPRESRIPLDTARVHYDEVSVVGSFHYTPSEARRALELLHEGAVPVDALITSTRRLEEYEDVFQRVSRGEEMKVAFVP